MSALFPIGEGTCKTIHCRICLRRKHRTAATIRRIAKEYGEAAMIGSTIEIKGEKLPLRPVSAVMFAWQGHTNSAHSYSALCLLNAIVGAMDVPVAHWVGRRWWKGIRRLEDSRLFLSLQRWTSYSGNIHGT